MSQDSLKFVSFLTLFCACLTAQTTDQVLAQPKSLFGDEGGLQLPTTGDAGAKDPQIAIKVDQQQVAAGDELTAIIEIKLDKKSYVYSQAKNFGAGTVINLTQVAGLEPIDKGFKPDKKPKTVVEPLFDNATLEKFYEGVTWTQKFRVTGSGTPTLAGEIKFQVCDDNNCKQSTEPILLTAELTGSSNGNSGNPPNLKMLFTDENQESASGSSAGLISGQIIDEITINPEREFGGPDPIEFNIKLVQSPTTEDKPSVAIVVTASIDGKWHLYAQTHDPEMAGIPTKFTLNDISGLSPIDSGFVPAHEPEVVEPEQGIIQKVFHDHVTWQQRFEPNAAGQQGPISGSILYMLCEEGGSCLPPNTIQFSLDPGDLNWATTVVAENPVDLNSSAQAPVEEEVPIQNQGLVPFIITGVLFGYLALLTPCVFPMIPITISFFLKQAEKKNHNPIGMATIYCLGIIGTFTFIGVVFAALFGATEATQFANATWLNIFLSAVLIFFGLNMLGMFEIQVPSWMLTWSSQKESQGGVLGVLFMSFTFTLVSFTCTFAFVGTLMPMASQGEYYWPIIGMVAFSAAFASPFFLLALFPSYLQKMPQSGGWMNRVKVTFGLIEIGAAFKFLSVADNNIFTVPYIFDYSLVMTTWMVLCFVTGFYLLGLFSLPHDSPSESISVVQLGFALSFLGFGAYLSAGIYSAEKPNGILWEQIVAFAPPTFEATEDVELGPALEHDDLLYALDVDQAIQFASANNQPMFFDFTGVNCVNCRAMEINVLSRNENHELLKEFVRVQLYTDTIPTITDSTQSDAMLEKNRRLQTDWFQDVSLPAYAVVTPDGQTILSSYKGKERAEGQFHRFLKTGLDAWQKKTAQLGGTTRR